MLDDRELPECGLVVVVRLGLVAKELIGPEQRPLRHRLRAGIRVKPADARPVNDGGDGVHRWLPAGARHLCGEVAHSVDVEVVGLAQPSHEHARRRDLPEGVDRGPLSRLPPDVPQLDELADRPVECAVDRARGSAGARHALEQVDDDDIRLRRADVTLDD